MQPTVAGGTGGTSRSETAAPAVSEHAALPRGRPPCGAHTGASAPSGGSTYRAVGRREDDSTRRGANMNIGLAYKVSIEAVMMITEFLAGWSSDGITAGVVTSVASRK